MNKEVCMRCMNAGWVSGWTIFDEERWNNNEYVACPAQLNKGCKGMTIPDNWVILDGPPPGCHFLLENIVLGQDDKP